MKLVWYCETCRQSGFIDYEPDRWRSFSPSCRRWLIGLIRQMEHWYISPNCKRPNIKLRNKIGGWFRC